MPGLLGRVPATEVAAAVAAAASSTARTLRRCGRERDERPLKGYKGTRARPSEVRREGLERRPRRQRRRLVFEGVILRERVVRRPPPRDELKTGYNVGLHVDRIEHVTEVGYKEAKYKIPEKEFPSRPTLRSDAPRDGRDDRLAPRLPDGRRIPPSAGPSSTAPCRSSRHLQPDDKEDLRRLLRETWRWRTTSSSPTHREEIAAGADGIVIGHGTTRWGTRRRSCRSWSRTARADRPRRLAALLDRPSSDAALNLIHSVRTAAYSDIAEVMICMFGRRPTGTDSSTAGRAAGRCTAPTVDFRTIGDIPLAM